MTCSMRSTCLQRKRTFVGMLPCCTVRVAEALTSVPGYDITTSYGGRGMHDANAAGPMWSSTESFSGASDYEYDARVTNVEPCGALTVLAVVIQAHDGWPLVWCAPHRLPVQAAPHAARPIARPAAAPARESCVKQGRPAEVQLHVEVVPHRIIKILLFETRANCGVSSSFHRSRTTRLHCVRPGR